MSLRRHRLPIAAVMSAALVAGLPSARFDRLQRRAGTGGSGARRASLCRGIGGSDEECSGFLSLLSRIRVAGAV